MVSRQPGIWLAEGMQQAKRRRHRTVAKIQELLRHYDEGTQSRVEFCTAHRLAVSGFDAYRFTKTPVLGGLHHEYRLVKDAA